jgi:hypothetical protein
MDAVFRFSVVPNDAVVLRQNSDLSNTQRWSIDKTGNDSSPVETVGLVRHSGGEKRNEDGLSRRR